MNRIRVIVKIIDEGEDKISSIIPTLEYNNVTEITDPCRLFSSIIYTISRETGLQDK